MKYFSINFVVLVVLSFSISFAQINWEKYEGNPVLVPGANGEWDDYCIGDFCILFDGNTYQMWFDGQWNTVEYRLRHIAGWNNLDKV